MFITPTVILTKFEPITYLKSPLPCSSDTFEIMLIEIVGHPVLPAEMLLLTLSPLKPDDMKQFNFSRVARKVVKMFNICGLGYCPVLERLWQLDPKRCIIKEDIKLIERIFANPENAEAAHSLLVLYVTQFECPHGVLRLAVSRCRKNLSLQIPLAVNGDSHELRTALKTLIQRATGKEFNYAIKLATKLEVKIDEQKFTRAWSKEWNTNALPVLEYYKVMYPEALFSLLKKWLALYLKNPEQYDISDELLEVMQPHIKKSLILQERLIRILLFVPMLANTKAQWTKAVNKELLATAIEPSMQGLIYVLQKTTKPEHQDQLPTFLPYSGDDVAMESFLKLCSGDKELKVKVMPPPSAEEEASYRQQYEGRTEVEVQMRMVTYTRFFSCGAIRAHLMGRRGMAYINNMPAADNIVIDVKKAVLEVIVDIPNTKKELVELPLEPISPELTLLIKGYLKHNRGQPHDKFDTKLHHQLLQKEIVLTRAWNGKWNYLVVHHPQLFSISTRKLWLNAMLGPERYLGDIMHRKRFKLERERILEKGLKIFREEGDAYLLLDVEFTYEPGIGTAMTQEFYSLYSFNLINALLNENKKIVDEEVTWRDLGIVVAQAILDERALDLSLVEPLLHGIGDSDKAMREYKKGVQEGIRKGIKRMSLIWPFELHELPKMLMASEPRIVLEPEQGYTSESTSIVWLQRFLDTERQRLQMFLEFCTGSPVTREAQVRVTVVPPSTSTSKKSTTELPTVMTCGMLLKLPRYLSFEVMRERMLYAIREGRESFFLVS